MTTRWKLYLDHLKGRWICLGAVLAVTLLLPSTREVQTLCFRWLLHLNGETFVEGAQTGDDFWNLIPNVQFTPKHLLEIRQCSTNSLDEFALACAVDIYDRHDSSNPPIIPAEAAWGSSPLLPWYAFNLTTMKVSASGTNAVPSEISDSLLRVLRLAETADRSNGALWQAEATLQFGAHDNAAAIRSLRTSVDRRNWTEYSEKSYEKFALLLNQAGWPELDAALQADMIFPPALYVQCRSVGFLDSLLTQAVSNGNSADFTNLFQLLVDLRRPDWVDVPPIYTSYYRRFRPSNELIEAMARQMRINLPTNWVDLDERRFEESKDTRGQIFQSFISRNADPVVTAIFNTQTEAYQTEKFLNKMLQNSYWEETIGLRGEVVAAGVCSLFFLSSLCCILVSGAFNWHLKTLPASGGKWPREFKFWFVAFVSVILSAWLIANFLQGIGIGVEADTAWLEPPPLLNLNPVALMISLFLSVLSIGVLVFQWKKAKLETGFLTTAYTLAVSYLACTVVLAFFRYQLLTVVARHHQ